MINRVPNSAALTMSEQNAAFDIENWSGSDRNKASSLLLEEIYQRREGKHQPVPHPNGQLNAKDEQFYGAVAMNLHKDGYLSDHQLEYALNDIRYQAAPDALWAMGSEENAAVQIDKWSGGNTSETSKLLIDEINQTQSREKNGWLSLSDQQFYSNVAMYLFADEASGVSDKQLYRDFGKELHYIENH